MILTYWAAGFYGDKSPCGPVPPAVEDDTASGQVGKPQRERRQNSVRRSPLGPLTQPRLEEFHRIDSPLRPAVHPQRVGDVRRVDARSGTGDRQVRAVAFTALVQRGEVVADTGELVHDLHERTGLAADAHPHDGAAVGATAGQVDRERLDLPDSRRNGGFQVGDSAVGHVAEEGQGEMPGGTGGPRRGRGGVVAVAARAAPGAVGAFDGGRKRAEHGEGVLEVVESPAWWGDSCEESHLHSLWRDSAVLSASSAGLPAADERWVARCSTAPTVSRIAVDSYVLALGLAIRTTRLKPEDVTLVAMSTSSATVSARACRPPVDTRMSAARERRYAARGGAGVLRLGQPATELNGGETQRIKLATELQFAHRGHALSLLD